MKPTKEVLNALEHVRKFHPDVIQVFYGIDCRWMYMDEDMESPVFGNGIDIGILEDAADSIEQFPAAFSWVKSDQKAE